VSHLATNENPGGGTPGLEGNTKNSHSEFTASREISQRKSAIDPVRLRYLARRLHALGERPLYELMRELVAGADPVARLDAYCRIDPAILVALGGVTLPAMMTAIDGGRQ
jgi:hypothetical protein